MPTSRTAEESLMTGPKIHYAGQLTILNFRTKRVSHIGAGYASCCSGIIAGNIKMCGNTTYDRDAVTCKSCKLQIQRADFTKSMRPDIKSIF
jgi:hypothetical protein